MARMIPALIGIALAAVPAAAQEAVRYELSWDNPASQLYTVRVAAPVEDGAVVFSLPAWRPGRYILQNYASNVQAVRAEDETGAALPVEWVDLDSWRVEPGGAREVTLAYEIYAAIHDAGASLLRPGLAYFNPVNILPWVEGRIDRPTRLTIHAPADWEIASQLDPAEGPNVFTAPSYHELVDAPTIASAELVHWRFSLEEVPYHVIFSGDLNLGPRTQEEILADLEAIATEQTAMMGGPPYPEYWFLYQLVPFPFGHAVEHSESASFVMTDNLFLTDPGYHGFLSITAHELFHAWNVKRIRPAALWPYDYSAPQLTRLHWFTEGVTSYYEELTLVRAGLRTPEQYWQALTSNVADLQTTPGRLLTSASVASLTAWHTGYGGGNPNQSISFYTKGALIGLLLDLTIRDATDGARSLDDVMRSLFTRTYEQGQGVPEDGIQRVAEEVAGRSLAEFFARTVHGTDEVAYEALLAAVGLTMRQGEDTTRPAASAGFTLRKSTDQTTVSSVAPDGPALEAEILRGDVVLEIDGTPAANADLNGILRAHQPGDAITLRIRRGKAELDKRMTLAGGGNVRWVVEPVADPTERQLRLREGWLASSTAGD